MYIAFLDYVKASDRVKRDKFFEILWSKNITNLLLKSTTEIDFRNKIKVKLSEEHKLIMELPFITHTLQHLHE